MNTGCTLLNLLFTGTKDEGIKSGDIVLFTGDARYDVLRSIIQKKQTEHNAQIYYDQCRLADNNLYATYLSKTSIKSMYPYRTYTNRKGRAFWGSYNLGMMYENTMDLLYENKEGCLCIIDGVDELVSLNYEFPYTNPIYGLESTTKELNSNLFYVTKSADLNYYFNSSLDFTLNCDYIEKDVIRISQTINTFVDVFYCDTSGIDDYSSCLDYLVSVGNLERFNGIDGLRELVEKEWTKEQGVIK
jgi:hypothetical protein